jgi:outer membrane lipopolysaccharide assembly protein LptE/RlpB
VNGLSLPVRIGGLLALSLIMAACGYRLAGRGDFLPPEIETIGVPPFANYTARPELEQRITEEILRQLQIRSSRKTSASRSGADAVLIGAVTGYRSTPVEINLDGRASTIQIIITARAQLQAIPDQEIIWAADNFTFRQNYPVGGGLEGSDFVDVEGLALDAVARDFAEAVVTSILEGF